MSASSWAVLVPEDPGPLTEATLASEFPEFAAAAAQSRYFQAGCFRNFDRQPDWDGLLKHLEELPAADPGHAYLQVWRKSDHEMYIRERSPRQSQDGKEEGVSRVYHVEPTHMEIVEGLGDWGEVAKWNEWSALNETIGLWNTGEPATVTQLAKRSYDYDAGGRVSQKLLFRNAREWSIAGKDVYFYWPNGKLRAVRHSGYPEDYRPDQLTVVDEFTKEGKPIPRPIEPGYDQIFAMYTKQRNIKVEAINPGAYYLKLPDGTPAIRYQYGRYGKLGVEAAFRLALEEAKGKVETKEEDRGRSLSERSFWASTPRGKLLVVALRDAVFTLEISDSAQQKDAERLARYIELSLGPQILY